MGNNLLVQEITRWAALISASRCCIEDSRHIWEDNLKEVHYTTVGSVIGTHLGPGAVVVAFFKNK